VIVLFLVIGLTKQNVIPNSHILYPSLLFNVCNFALHIYRSISDFDFQELIGQAFEVIRIVIFAWSFIDDTLGYENHISIYCAEKTRFSSANITDDADELSFFNLKIDVF
jgi:hypothetical protein